MGRVPHHVSEVHLGLDGQRAEELVQPDPVLDVRQGHNCRPNVCEPAVREVLCDVGATLRLHARASGWLIKLTPHGGPRASYLQPGLCATLGACF